MAETRYVYASFWLDDGTLGVCLRPATDAEVAELPPWYVVTVGESADAKGDSRSGNWGHAGRQGLVGGSAPATIQPANGDGWTALAHVQMSERLRADYQVRARLVNFDRHHAALIAQEVAAAVAASPALRAAEIEVGSANADGWQPSEVAFTDVSYIAFNPAFWDDKTGTTKTTALLDAFKRNEQVPAWADERYMVRHELGHVLINKDAALRSVAYKAWRQLNRAGTPGDLPWNSLHNERELAADVYAIIRSGHAVANPACIDLVTAVRGLTALPLTAATKVLPTPGAPLAPWPADMPVPITALDVTRALAAWDEDVPAAAGLWDAQVVGRAGKARRGPV